MQPQQNLRLCHIVVDHLYKVPVFKQNRDDNMIEAKHDKIELICGTVFEICKSRVFILEAFCLTLFKRIRQK